MTTHQPHVFWGKEEGWEVTTHRPRAVSEGWEKSTHQPADFGRWGCPGLQEPLLQESRRSGVGEGSGV